MFPYKAGEFFSCVRKTFGPSVSDSVRHYFFVVSVNNARAELENIYDGKAVSGRMQTEPCSPDEPQTLITKDQTLELWCSLTLISNEEALSIIAERARALEKLAHDASTVHQEYLEYVMKRQNPHLAPLEVQTT